MNRIMPRSSIKNPLVFLLIFAINYAQLAPGFAGSKQKKVQVAFVGIKFEDVAPDLQERILERVIETIESRDGLQLIKPSEIQKTISPEKIAQILAQPDSSSFRALAEQLQANFVIAGRIANQGRDHERVLLVGELNRFDLATNLLHKFEILKYYENFGVELVKFKQEYVATMASAESDGKTSLAVLVLVGITVAGVVALALSSIRTGAEGDGTPPTERP